MTMGGEDICMNCGGDRSTHYGCDCDYPYTPPELSGTAAAIILICLGLSTTALGAVVSKYLQMVWR